MEHTPGPWKIEEWPERGETMIVKYNAPDTWPKFGVGCTIDTPLDYCNADARLIASAPEMLEALRQARGYIMSVEASEEIMGMPSLTLQMIDAAIAKAEGR